MFEDDVFHPLRPELELVARLARIRPSREDRDRARSLLDGDLCWDLVLNLAMDHRVVPLAFRNLSDLKPDGVPPEAMGRFKLLRDGIVKTNLAWFAEFLRLSSDFQDRGIPTVAVKGFPLAQMVYGDVGLRQFGDLDLFVRPTDVPQAIEVLNGLGYRLKSEEVVEQVGLRRVMQCLPQLQLSSDRGIWVDLQWRFGGKGGLVEFPIAECVSAPALLRLGSQDVPQLAQDALLPFLLLHGHKHGWKRLRWLVDIAEFIERLPPEGESPTCSHVEALGAEDALRTALWLMRVFWDRPVPRAFERYVTTGSVSRGMKKHLWGDFEGPGPEPGPAWVWARGILRELRYQRLLGSPQRQHLELLFRPTVQDLTFVRLPRGLRFLYWVVRPIRLLEKGLTLMLAGRSDRAGQTHGSGSPSELK